MTISFGSNSGEGDFRAHYFRSSGICLGKAPLSPCIVTASHLVGEGDPGTLLLLCPLTWTHNSDGEATCTDMGFRGLAMGVCKQGRRNAVSDTEPEANSRKLLHRMCKILSGEFGFQGHLVKMVRNAITIIPYTFFPFLNETVWN